MRVVKEIAHPQCKITIFSWNNRYLIKLEQGLLEQTFKIDQSDLTDESALIAILDQTFIDEALKRFAEMYHSLDAARDRSPG